MIYLLAASHNQTNVQAHAQRRKPSDLIAVHRLIQQNNDKHSNNNINNTSSFIIAVKSIYSKYKILTQLRLYNTSHYSSST